MTDIHCHLMYGIDDGCHDILESVKILEEYKKCGFNNVILTPHYIEGASYSANNTTKDFILDNLKYSLKENNIDINIYVGNEIFISNDIDALVKKGEVYPLNNTKYVLIEFPFNNNILNMNDILYNLKCKGYIPIIAHPERYTYFQKNPKLVDDMYKDGILFQGNYSSILGTYGRGAKKLFKYMLRNHYISYLGTDIHHYDKLETLKKFTKINKKIMRLTGPEFFNEIMKNCDSLVNQPIENQGN